MSCDWPIDRSVLPDLPETTDPNYSAALLARNAAEDLAVSVLWALSGRRFGICEATARPCPARGHLPWRGVGGYDPVSPFVPVFFDGAWRRLQCCGSAGCHRSGPRAVHLPGPVVQIVTVTIGTTVLDEDDYVLEGDVLYRKDERWPFQDLGRPLGEDRTWSVIYDRGEAVPGGVDGLTGMLAKEFLAASSGDKCRLPRNVSGVTRNGVSYQVYNPNDIFAAGKVGLAEVDMWLAAINPHQLMKAPSVL